MTSVLNHLQRLNGSKFLVFLLVFSLASCSKKSNDIFRDRDTQTVKTDRPKRDKKQDIPVKKDDNVIKIDEDNSPVTAKPKNPVDEMPQTSDPSDIVKKDMYSVAVMAPFDVNQTLTSATDDKFLQYFGGMVIASEELNRTDNNIDIRIIDTKNKDINTLLKSDLATDTDVIVGPYNKENLSKAMEYAKENEITLVSPWIARSPKKNNNPYYVQLSPYTTEYFKSLMKQVSARHSEGDVYIVGRLGNAKDARMIAVFQQLAQILWRSSNSTPLKEVLISEDQLNGEDPVFLPAMENNNKTVFIIPNLRGYDDNYVYNVLRRISLEKSLNNIDVYGMFRILDNPRVDFELYNTLNLKVLSSKYVDVDDVKVKNFRRVFLEKFGELPNVDAYRGYDNFIWLGNALKEHGENFRYHTNGDVNRDFLQESYSIRPIQRSNEDGIRYFENSAIDLIEFKDGKFVRSK